MSWPFDPIDNVPAVPETSERDTVAEPEQALTYLGAGQGQALRKRFGTVDSFGEPDMACRSVPPGGPRPQRYTRNLVAEELSARYGVHGQAVVPSREKAAPSVPAGLAEVPFAAPQIQSPETQASVAQPAAKEAAPDRPAESPDAPVRRRKVIVARNPYLAIDEGEGEGGGSGPDAEEPRRDVPGLSR